jgi:hypothetical protein
MSNSDLADGTSPIVNKIAKQLRRVGVMGFWVQIVLAAVSTIILVFAIPSAGSSLQNPSTSGGILLAASGLLLLYGSIYWFYNYIQIAIKLRNPNDNRPRKADTIKTIRWGTIISLAGMGLNVLAAQAIGGNLFLKSIAVAAPWAMYSPDVFSKIVQPLDVFILLANTNIIFAHLIALASSLWLLDRIAKENKSA